MKASKEESKKTPKAQAKTRFSFVKSPRFYIPASIFSGILVVGLGALLIMNPGIVRGEFDFQSLVDMVMKHETRITGLEKKTDNTQSQTNTNPTDTKAVTSNPTATATSGNGSSTKSTNSAASTPSNNSTTPTTFTPTTPTTTPTPIPIPYIANWTSYFSGPAGGGPGNCGSGRTPCSPGQTYTYDVHYVDTVNYQRISIIDCSGSYATNGNGDPNPPYYQYPVSGVVIDGTGCRYSFTAQYHGGYSIHASATTDANTPEKTKVFINQSQPYF